MKNWTTKNWWITHHDLMVTFPFMGAFCVLLHYNRTALAITHYNMNFCWDDERKFTKWLPYHHIDWKFKFVHVYFMKQSLGPTVNRHWCHLPFDKFLLKESICEEQKWPAFGQVRQGSTLPVEKHWLIIKASWLYKWHHMAAISDCNINNSRPYT